MKRALHTIFVWLCITAAISFSAGFLVLFTGCSIVPTGKQIWNPLTWFSGKALPAAQKADAKEAKAVERFETKSDQLVHAGHLEFRKAELVLQFMAISPDAALAHRFVRGGLGLLDQVDPVTAAESSDLIALVTDLRSGDARRIAAAEAKQTELEGKNADLSRQLDKLQGEITAARQASKDKDVSLQKAFLRENELADTLRNERVIRWVAIGGVIFLAALCLYLRMGLGSVGAALSGLSKVIGPEAASKVITQLDANTDWLHQVVVGAGRKAADAARAKALSDAAEHSPTS